MEGASSLMAGIVIIACLNVWFVRNYLRLEDEDEYGGILTLLQEGAFPALATFVVRHCRLSLSFATPHGLVQLSTGIISFHGVCRARGCSPTLHFTPKTRTYFILDLAT